MLGATRLDEGLYNFRVWAPRAEHVELHLFGRDERFVPMERGPHGYCTATVEATPGTRYRYRLDGGDELPDPASRWQPDGVHGPSAIVDPTAFPWTDELFQAPPLPELVLYELHVGTFTAEGTFDGGDRAAGRPRRARRHGLRAPAGRPVPGIAQLGLRRRRPLRRRSRPTAGPTACGDSSTPATRAASPSSSTSSTTTSGPRATTSSGSAPYFSDRYHTPWGQAVNFDGPGSDEVRRFFFGNALHWLDEYHVDGLRLDAIHGIVDTSAVPFWRELSEVVAQLGERRRRRLTLIGESDLNDPRVMRPVAAGGLGLDSRSGATTSTTPCTPPSPASASGYYVDFGTLGDIAKALRQGFVYDGRDSQFRGRRHGAAPAGLDGAPLRRLHPEPRPGRQPRARRAAAGARGLRDGSSSSPASCCSRRSCPLLFMGEEYGETAPFQYFTDHADAELNEGVRAGRAREFAAIARAGILPDAQDPDTFARSRLDWSLREQGRHGQLLELYRELLRLRRTLAPLTRLSLRDADVTLVEEAQTILLRRRAGNDEVLAAFHVGDGDSPPVRLPAGGWLPLCDSADTRFDGPGAGQIGSDGLVLAPWSFVLLERSPV